MKTTEESAQDQTEIEDIREYLKSLPRDTFTPLSAITPVLTCEEKSPGSFVGSLLIPVLSPLHGQFVSGLVSSKQEAEEKAVRKAWSALRDAKLIGPDASGLSTSATVLPEQLRNCMLPQQQPLEYLGIPALHNDGWRDSHVEWPDECVFVRVEITPPQSTRADLGFIYSPTAPLEHVTFAMQCQLNDEMVVWLEPSLLKWSALPSQCYLDVLDFHT